MQITIKLYGNLRKHLPQKKELARMEIENAMTIRELLARLGVPDSNVWMCAVNDRVVSDSTALREGDVLEVFEPVGGGMTSTSFRAQREISFHAKMRFLLAEKRSSK